MTRLEDRSKNVQSIILGIDQNECFKIWGQNRWLTVPTNTINEHIAFAEHLQAIPVDNYVNVVTEILNCQNIYQLLRAQSKALGTKP